MLEELELAAEQFEYEARHRPGRPTLAADALDAAVRLCACVLVLRE